MFGQNNQKTTQCFGARARQFRFAGAAKLRTATGREVINFNEKTRLRARGLAHLFREIKMPSVLSLRVMASRRRRRLRRRVIFPATSSTACLWC